MGMPLAPSALPLPLPSYVMGSVKAVYTSDGLESILVYLKKNKQMYIVG